MRIGFAVPMAGSWATPDNQVHLALLAERLGYGSLWTMQRLLNPVDSTDGLYRNVPDPMLTLAYLAASTSTARLGVAVLNMPFVSPVLLGKQAATLDLLSAGRLDLGLGLGWMPEEFTASGATKDRLGARGEEFIAVLRALWTGRTEPFAGEFYALPAAIAGPTPVQGPHPPILLGGHGPRALRRAGRLADGWVSASRFDLRAIGSTIAAIRDAAEEAGRDPAALRFIVRGALVGPDAAEDAPLRGSYEDIRAGADWLGEQGVTEVFYDLNFDRSIAGLDVDPAESVARAEEAIEALAPM